MADPARPAPPPAPPEFPRLRRFEVLEELGRGNTGTIYLVRAKVALGGLRPGDHAALKLLHPHLLAQEEARRAFLREARAGMGVRHPNLVKIYAVEEVAHAGEHRLYLVLEAIAGHTLREILLDAALPLEPTLRILGRQIAGALAALHTAGLLHLDVKPENIAWDGRRAVLMDLGFARCNPEAPRPPGGGGHLESGGSDALFVGTPAYAAPELLAGRKPAPAVDLFALGVTLYESATGVRPFGDEREFGLFEARRTAVVRKPSTIQPRLSPFFNAVVMKLLAEDPARRFRSAAELQEVLARGEQSGWWRDHDDRAPVLPVIHPGALPFGNRTAEMTVIESAFRRAVRNGEPRMLVLGGPAGVGKSRLVLEAAARFRARRDSPPFLYGRCRRLERGSAFRAVLDALARSLGLTPGQPPSPAVERRLEASLPTGAAQVLIQLLHGRIHSREVRRRAFLDWFRALGREGPFFVFFDDLQATGSSLWTFMLRVLELEQVPALILLAHREPLEDAAADARRRLLRGRRVLELPLLPLSRSDTGALLEKAFVRGTLPPALKADFLHVARGNPGSVTDLLRLLVRRGEIVRGPDGFRPAQDPVHLPLTGDQAELLRTELSEMEPPDRELLLWAAMLTPPLDPGLLAELCELDEASVLDQLQSLRAAGWLKLEGGRYRFTQPRYREAAYRHVAPRGQRRRHARLYEVLSATRRDVADRRGARAFHAHRAGLHREALRIGLPQVERRLQGGAFERAARTLEVLEEHAGSLGWEALPLDQRVRLLIVRAHVAGWRGDRIQEAEDLQEAGRLAREAEDDALAARVHLGLARHGRAMGFASAARVHLERAKALLGRAGGPGAATARRRRASGSSGRNAPGGGPPPKG